MLTKNQGEQPFPANTLPTTPKGAFFDRTLLLWIFEYWYRMQNGKVLLDMFVSKITPQFVAFMSLSLLYGIQMIASHGWYWKQDSSRSKLTFSEGRYRCE